MGFKKWYTLPSVRTRNELIVSQRSVKGDGSSATPGVKHIIVLEPYLITERFQIVSAPDYTIVGKVLSVVLKLTEIYGWTSPPFGTWMFLDGDSTKPLEDARATCMYIILAQS